MKKTSIRIAASLLLLCSLMATAASAKVTSQVVTFGSDFVVGGTSVKSGTYRVSFDDKTNELTVSDAKTKAVIAKATASAGKRQSRGTRLEFLMVSQGDTRSLSSIAFEGQKQLITVGGSGSAADSAQQ
jgi:hypothetical protein